MGHAVKFITDENGARTGVLMELADYESLLEDVRDLAAIADRRGEPTAPHEDFIRQLRADGLFAAGKSHPFSYEMPAPRPDSKPLS